MDVMRIPQRFRKLVTDTSALPGLCVSLWRREFQDARIILEQGGNLHYLCVTARLQRLMVRGAMVMGGLVSMAVLTLSITSLALHQGKAQLERNHQEIYSALMGSFAETGLTNSEAISKEEMIELARSIRERDIEIRQIVDSATSNLSAENNSLKSRIHASGLTEQAIKIIQSNSAVGGLASDARAKLPSVLLGKFSTEAADNLSLNEILMALPSRMPVNAHDLTSMFGIRKHPIHGEPRLHAGIDLVPHSDDRVFPVKVGKVVMARPYSNYGNTVVVRHDRGVESLYAHLDSIAVREGQEVSEDTVLGMVGNTGASTGKHLHFEITVGGYPVDPLKVIKTAQNVQPLKK
jgi:murein DD-endopeptidase MepM/ murein hydrolase activator NlpD